MQNISTNGEVAGNRFALSKAFPVLLKEGDSWVCLGHLIKSKVLGFCLTTYFSMSLINPQ